MKPEISSPETTRDFGIGTEFPGIPESDVRRPEDESLVDDDRVATSQEVIETIPDVLH